MEKHFVDSIILNIFVELKWKIADIWTGWWFPLIPLAITNQECDFVWIDSVWKKLKAVEYFSNELNLKNITTVNSRAEEVWQNKKYREQFDFVTSRATAFLPVLIEYCLPLLKIWWIFCAYKLEDKEELKKSKKALIQLWAKILKVKNYEIDWQKRVIILIIKKYETHKKYPRKIWIALSKPL
jgi:16S rRNA (guanine527-N7)-methyltransferase